MKKLNILFALVLISYQSILLAASFEDIDLESMKLITESKDIKIYIKPGVDLSEYKFLILEQAQATLDKKWLDNYNRKRQTLRTKASFWDAESITRDYAKYFDTIANNYLEKNTDYSLAPIHNTKGLRLEFYINKLVIYQPDHDESTRALMISKAGEAELDTVMYDTETGEIVAALLDHKETFEKVQTARSTRSRIMEQFEPIYEIWMDDLVATLSLKAD